MFTYVFVSEWDFHQWCTYLLQGVSRSCVLPEVACLCTQSEYEIEHKVMIAECGLDTLGFGWVIESTNTDREVGMEHGMQTTTNLLVKLLTPSFA